MHDCSSSICFVFFPMISSGLLLWWTFAGLHCEYLHASTVVCDFEQCTMLTSVHGATIAFEICPSVGYISAVSMFKQDICDV
jgi:hypothetical protein